MIFAKVEKYDERLFSEVTRSLLFENDPGLRNITLVGQKHLQILRKVVIISSELNLVCLADKSKPYWSLLTTDGKIMNLCPELKVILKELEWTTVKSVIISANICQLMLFYEPANLINQRAVAYILNLSQTGHLIYKHKLEFPY